MLTVSKKSLLAALSVLELVPTRPGIPASEFIRITPKQQQSWLIMVLSSEVNGLVVLKGEGKWPFKEDVYVDRRLFIPFIRAGAEMKDDEIRFLVKDKQLVVLHGKRKASFNMQPAVPGYGPTIDMTEIKQSKSTLDISDGVKSLIYGARECATTDHTTPELNCVYVKPAGDQTAIYATNQTLIFKSVSEEKMKAKEAIPFPLFLVTLIGSEGLKTIQWRDKEVILEFGCGYIWQPVSTKAKANFPVKSIDTWMSKEDDMKTAFRHETKAFCDILTRIGSYLVAVRRQDWLLKMSGKKGDESLSLEVAISQGVFKESIKLNEPVKSDFSVDWPLDMLLPVFESVRKDKGTIKIQSSDSRSLFSTKRVKVIIPTRKA